MSTSTSVCEEQVVLILVGLVGSGKSTFAQALEKHLPDQFRRCNQDDLGDRGRVEMLARRSLREGLSVCIDRTNFNAAQRSYWINIAQEFPGILVWVIVFRTPYEVCAARLRERVFHPTIKSPEQGLSVLARFSNEFQDPSDDEGHHRLIVLTPSDHPSPVYTPGDITTILQRLRDSKPVTPAVSTSSSWTRGNSSFLSGRGVNSRRSSGVPQARRAAGPYLINSRRSRSSFGRSAPSGSLERSRNTVAQPNNDRRDSESRLSIQGGTSDSQNWRGSGSAENPLSIA